MAMYGKADIYHIHDPELIPVALVLKVLGKTVVYDVHENVSKQILSKHWIRPCLRRSASQIFRAIEMLAARCFDEIVAATPAIARQFPPGKTTIVQNFPIVGELVVQSLAKTGPPTNHIAYVGAISRPRGICKVVEALEKTTSYPNIRLTLAGRFSPPELESVLRKMAAWVLVDYLGQCDRPKVASLLAASAMGIVTFLPEPNHIEAQPNKLFEYMSAGLPVIASDFPLWRKIVSDVDCGLLVDPEDSQAIADAITWLLEHPDEAQEMGRRGQQAIQSKYNWDSEFEKLLEMYQRVLNEDYSLDIEQDSVAHAA